MYFSRNSMDEQVPGITHRAVGRGQFSHLHVQFLHSSRDTFPPCHATMSTRAHMVRVVLYRGSGLQIHAQLPNE
jgi:hypothetical protein